MFGIILRKKEGGEMSGSHTRKSPGVTSLVLPPLLAGIYYFLGGIASSTHVDSDDDTAPPACLCGDLATMDYPVNKEGTVAVWDVQNHNEDGRPVARPRPRPLPVCLP